LNGKNVIIAVVLVGALLTGCSGKETAPAAVVKKPSLDIALDVNGNEATVKITTDLHISPEHYGLQRVEGEGHIHMFVDNGEKVGVKSAQTVIKDLSKGKHNVKISLHNNDHTPYEVSKTVEFEVK
jgi:hypothetical protein